MSETNATIDDGIVVVNTPHATREGAGRYELRDGDTVIGFTRYREREDGALVFDHTKVEEVYGGRGLAGRLAAFAFADVREQQRRLVPVCPYIAAWARKHPEYADIVDWPESTQEKAQ